MHELRSVKNVQKPDFRGLPHETIQEFLGRGGIINKVSSLTLQDVIKKIREEFRESFNGRRTVERQRAASGYLTLTRGKRS